MLFKLATSRKCQRATTIASTPTPNSLCDFFANGVWRRGLRIALNFTGLDGMR